MGLVGQILGKSRRVQFIQNDQTVIELDCSIQETHARQVVATQFEVEDGTTISDHLIVKNQKLEVQGLISDTPIGTIQSILNTVIGTALPARGVVSIAVGQALFSALSGSSSPSVNAYAQLLQLQLARQPLSVITTLRRYDKVFITDISAPRDSGTGQSLIFTMSLEQLKIVSPQTVVLTNFKSADLAADKARLNKLNKGNAALDALKKGESDALKVGRTTLGVG